MAQVSAVAFGCLSICYGIRGVISPKNFAIDFGFSPEQPGQVAKSAEVRPYQRNPFVTATGGRTAAIGLAILMLSVDNQLAAAGTVILCCALSGLCDTISCYVAGKTGPVLQHAVGTVVLGTFGAWLRFR